MANANGGGEALEAAAATEETEEPAEETGGMSDADKAALADNVEKAKAKVAQAEAHLAGAQESLANAEAEAEGI